MKFCSESENQSYLQAISLSRETVVPRYPFDPNEFVSAFENFIHSRASIRNLIKSCYARIYQDFLVSNEKCNILNRSKVNSENEDRRRDNELLLTLLMYVETYDQVIGIKTRFSTFDEFLDTENIFVDQSLLFESSGATFKLIKKNFNIGRINVFTLDYTLLPSISSICEKDYTTKSPTSFNRLIVLIYSLNPSLLSITNNQLYDLLGSIGFDPSEERFMRMKREAAKKMGINLGLKEKKIGQEIGLTVPNQKSPNE